LKGVLIDGYNRKTFEGEFRNGKPNGKGKKRKQKIFPLIDLLKNSVLFSF